VFLRWPSCKGGHQNRDTTELLLAAWFAALFLSLLLGLSRPTSAWLLGSYGAVYVTIIFATIMRRRRKLGQAA
jgi:hypothetical protein